MRVAFVSIDYGLMAIGFRKVAAVARLLHPDTEVFHISPGTNASPLNYIFPKRTFREPYSSGEIDNIAQNLAVFDMVCFSSMTVCADLTKKILTSIRSANPKVYIVWGGIHPIVYSDDAMPFADAICVGEGERAFREFFTSFAAGSDFTNTNNFWFNSKGTIIKNSFHPLSSPEERDTYPFPVYADRELMYRKEKQGFTNCEVSDYLTFNNLSYSTVWSVGCPNRCTYCSNSKFIENDKNYRKVRHTSVEYIIGEVEHALQRHPHISTVSFIDDSFMAIPYAAIEQFAKMWKERIDLPFVVLGVIPSYVKREKLDVLVKAGMNRIRMGIQSGSDRILAFYKRPNPSGMILNAATIISDFKQQMIPPAYDIILDNPIETKEDVLATLQLIYDMPRPFTLNIFSLRVMPNTEMAHEFERLNVNIKDRDHSVHVCEPTIANMMVYCMVLFKPPKWLFQRFLSFVRPSYETQPLFPIMLTLLRILYSIKRASSHIRFLDFSVALGKPGYLLWKMGLLKSRKPVTDTT